MAINDVLPLFKAVRRNASGNLKCFGTTGHQRPHVNDFIYIHYAAPPYAARISSIYLLPFGKVWLGPFADFRVRRLAEKHAQSRTYSPILSRLFTEVHEILKQCR